MSSGIPSRAVFFLLVSCLLSVPLIAKEKRYRFEHLTAKDGLSQYTVQSILQDRFGFLWFGSQMGLNRYDGYQFRVFLADRNDPHSLSEHNIRTMLEDSEGYLWIGTSHGLNRYDQSTEKFTPFLHDPNDDSTIPGNSISSILEDHEKNLWVLTQPGGIAKLDRRTGTFQKVLFDPNRPTFQQIDRLFLDRHGTIWAAADGLYRFEQDHFIKFQPTDSKSASVQGDRILSIHEGPGGLLYAGSDNGDLNIITADRKGLSFYKIENEDSKSLEKVDLRSILEDSRGELWLASYQAGLMRLDRDAGKFQHYRPDEKDPHSISANKVEFLHEDRQGIVRVGTWYQGVDQIDPGAIKFQIHLHNINNPNSLNSDNVTAIFQDRDGLIWIGTDKKEMNLFDRKTGIFSQLIPEKREGETLDFSYTVMIEQDRDGNMLFTTWGRGIYIYNPKTKGFKHYWHDPNSPKSLSSNRAWAIHHDRDGNTWIGTSKGLDLYHPETETFIRFQHDKDNPHSIGPGNPVAIKEDKKGNLWIAHVRGGLSVMNRKTRLFKNYRRDPENYNSLSDDTIWGIHISDDNTIWLATRSGLTRMDPERENFINYGKQKDYLTSGLISLLEDDDGNLWGTNNAPRIVKFDPILNRFRSYDSGDGLTRGYVTPAFRTDDGELFFAGYGGGVTSFFPKEMKDNFYIPPVVFTNFLIFNKQVPIGVEGSALKQSIQMTKSLTLTYKDAVFSIEFAALNYRTPEKNRYAYRMEGLEEEWNHVGSDRRLVTYTSLPPGDYTFHVKASNNDNVWNEKGALLRIRVVPPFWRTWWFFLTLLILFTGSLIFFFRLRINFLKRQKERLEVKVIQRTQELKTAKEQAEIAKEQAEEAKEEAEVANQAKSDFLARMSHELRTPLNAILGFAQILEKKQESKEKEAQDKEPNIIRKSGEHLLTLINDILDLSKIEAGKVDFHPAPFSLETFLSSIVSIMKVKADQKRIEFHYFSGLVFSDTVFTDETRLRQVLINLLGNAIKFTDHGEVRFKVVEEVMEELPENSENEEGSMYGLSLFYFEIEDTGVGIYKKAIKNIFSAFEQAGDVLQKRKGTGLGLAISREIVKLMGSDIQVTSTPGLGSSFRFAVKLQTTKTTAHIHGTIEKKIIGYTLKSGRPIRILITDDNLYNRTLLLTMLVSIGFEVREAENGQKCVDLVESWNPDLIFLDIVMPVMDGFQATRAIREVPDQQSIVIIAASASVSNKDRKSCLEQGFDDFLAKPINFDELFSMLEKYLDLEWIYEEESKEVSSNATTSKGELIPPSKESLKILYERASRGNMRKLVEEADRIEAGEPQAALFAKKIKELAEEYRDHDALELIEEYFDDYDR